MVLPRHIDPTREPIVESCIGCERISVEGEKTFCKAYVKPEVFWRHGKYCPLATHFKLAAEKEKKVNPLKASKRSRKK